MQSIYDPATLQKINKRIETLHPDAPSLWGKMDIAQMMAHCCKALEVTVGDKSPKSTLMAKVLGRYVKSVVTSEQPFKPSLPTDPSFVVATRKDFDNEKQRLKALLTRLSTGGPDALKNRKHPFFGPLSPAEWSTLTVKHLDHHLRQFGV